MRTISKLPLLLFSMLAPLVTFAQAPAPNWLVDTLYGSGKMNTVIAVVMVVLVGLLIWLFILDRKIKRLENK